MKGIGWTLIVVGTALVAWAILSPVTVRPDLAALAAAGEGFPQTVVNLELLQWQIIKLESGLACLIMGTVAACVGALRDAMIAAGTAKIVYRPGWDPETAT